jgi:hypothetical protein
MKTSFLNFCIPFLLISGLNLNAQEAALVVPVDPDTKLITYKEVVTVPGNPSELFNRAIEWVNKQYKNPTDATKVRNPATGLIEIIHRIELTKDEKGVMRPAGIVDYSLKIEMKEGRYRYTITNFNYKDVSRQPIEIWLNKNDKAYIPAWDNYLKQVDDASRKLIESLNKGMQPPAVIKEDTW